MYFCGLDVGTSGVKAVIFDTKGNIIRTAYREYNLELKSDGTREIRAQEIWHNTKEVLKEAICEFTQVKTIAVSTFGEAFIPIDKDGNELSEVMIYTDRRGESEYFDAMKKTSDEEIAQICGLPPSPTFSVSKLLYIKHNLPKIYDDTKHFLLIGDYITYKLGGYCTTPTSLACRTMLFDVNKKQWSNHLLNKFEIDIEKLSTTTDTGTKLGKIRSSIATELNINKEIEIIAGGHDQPMSAIGIGFAPKTTVCSMGTSECMTPVFEGTLNPEITLKSSLSSELIFGNKYCTLAYNATSGLLIKWFFDNYAHEYEKPPYKLFEENLKQTPSTIMVQPYLMGSGTPYMDHKALFALIGADIGTNRYDVYKGVIEGLCLDQRLNYEVIKSQKIDIESLVCVGGASKNKAWLQAKADIMQVSVHTLKCSEAGALGCAIMGAVALGEYKDIEQAGENMCERVDTIEPNKANKAFYDEKFQLYKTLHKDAEKYCNFAYSYNGGLK